MTAMHLVPLLRCSLFAKPAGLRLSTLAVLALCLLAEAAAQPGPPVTLDPSLQLTQYVHRAWQAEDGLPQNSVRALVQTQDGYLWLGTQEGLVRFDGVRFDVLDQNALPGLRSNQILALHEDRRGYLWIGTNGGGISRLRGGRLATFTVEAGLSSNVATVFLQDRKDHLWIGTIGGGVCRFDGVAFACYTTDQGLAGNNVLSLQEDRDGALWIGTQSGLSRLSNGTFTTSTTAHGLPADAVRTLLLGRTGRLWIGTDNGLASLEQERFTAFTTADGLPANAVGSLYEDASGMLWIGTIGGGLARFEHGRFSTFTTRNGLTHDQVRALLQDREGNLWIGTDGGGLNQLRGSKFATLTTREGLSHDVVLSVLEDRAGDLWIGTDGGGLNRIRQGNVTQFTAQQGLAGDIIAALHEDRDGHLWVGVLNGGLCRLEAERFFCFTAADGLPNNNVYSIHDDRRGNLWIGTDAGLGRYRNGRFSVLTTEDGLPLDLITAILESQDGDVWLGTYGGGLVQLSEERMVSYGLEDGLSSELILALYEDAAGTLWVGTEGGGLCRLQAAGRFDCFTTQNGLHNNNVLQILEDEAGYLWLGSLKGISRVRRRDLDAGANGYPAPLKITVYTEADGLRSSETNGGTQPAAWKTRDGHLCFATMEGLARINATDIPVNTLPPPVLLEEITVDGVRIDTAGALALKPGSKKLEFRYTALSFIHAPDLAFRYKLEGYDDDWLDAGKHREIYYTSLPPGVYRFNVKARNHDGIWNEEGASVTFHVQPLFHQTLWFYLICAAGLVLLGAGGYGLRARHLKARERSLTLLVHEQTQALAALNKNLEAEVQRQLTVILTERQRYEHELIRAKEKAEESAQLKSLILTNMSHEIRTPITAILGYAQVLSEEVGDEYQEFADYIEENGKRLLHTLNSILDLSKLEQGSFSLQATAVDLSQAVLSAINLLMPVARSKGLLLQATPSTEKAVALLDQAALDRILHNLIGNAVKFTEEGGVTVETGMLESAVFIRVRDTGIGISEAFLPHLFEEFKQESTGLTRSHEGSGLGLAITRRLVEAMDGQISVESRKEQGAVVTVYFPAGTADACSSVAETYGSLRAG